MPSRRFRSWFRASDTLRHRYAEHPRRHPIPKNSEECWVLRCNGWYSLKNYPIQSSRRKAGWYKAKEWRFVPCIYNKVGLHSFFVHDSRSHGYLWHTDGHGWTRITVRMLFLNTNRTNFTNIFGTRMDTDEHGFTVRMVAFWTRISNIFGHTDTHSKFAENIRVIREIRVQK